MVPVAFLCFFVTNSIKTHEHSAAGAGECASRDATDAEAEIEAQEMEAQEIEAQGFSVVRDAALTDDSARAHGEEGQEAEDGCAHAARLVWSIVSNRVWLCATLGYAGYTFSIGAMAVWGPAFLQRRFGVALEEADVWFGATAVVTGLLGTIGDMCNSWAVQGSGFGVPGLGFRVLGWTPRGTIGGWRKVVGVTCKGSCKALVV